MDLRRLSRALPNPGVASGNNSNTTEPLSLTDLPPTILDALIPGYSVISRYAQAILGIDISLFVSIIVVFLAVTKSSQYLLRQAESQLRKWFVSSVYIDEHDDLFDMVMAWLAKNQGAASRRSVRAKTQRGNRAQAEQDENFDSTAVVNDALDENGMFDFNKWSARMPPRFEPYYGRHRLRFNGTWFFVRRSQKSGDRMAIQWGSHTQDDLIQIDCLGRSIAPIEGLLRAIKVWSLDRMRYTTTIRHPTPKDRGRFGGAWSKTSSRPSRPMDTVILDAEQKAGIIKDMNEYLHPASPRWYARRGIPYRRGYLFYGPPGTGKTSLSFALAGIFGLEIYAISLQEPSLTEGDLMQLFNALPRRCIVLLEDVDAAGLIRDGKSDAQEGGGGAIKRKGKKGETEDEKTADEKKKKKGGKKNKDSKEEGIPKEDKKEDSDAKKPNKDEDYTLRDLARELRALAESAKESQGPARHRPGRGEPDNTASQPPAANNPNNNNAAQTGGHPNRQPGAGISLSGLLNAIDGVATHEGRVLIMTTNHPEKLDSALIRPGRVDRRVEFKLAMKEQVRELFVRMYAATEEDTRTAFKASAAAAANAWTGADAAKTEKEKGMNGSAHLNGSLDGKASLSNGSPKTDLSVANGHAKGDSRADDVKPLAQPPNDSPVEQDELEDLAVRFAAEIPDDTFTPAEIQNLLMRHKEQPRVALEKVGAWMKEIEEEKEKQQKEEDDDDSESESDDEEEHEGKNE